MPIAELSISVRSVLNHYKKRGFLTEYQQESLGLYKEYLQHQNFTLTPSLEELIPQVHPARIVGEVVEGLIFYSGEHARCQQICYVPICLLFMEIFKNYSFLKYTYNTHYEHYTKFADTCIPS